jgi:hypothetical protein
MKSVIAISGYKQSGKDTVANYLINKYGVCRISFADPLKDMVAQQYDISRESLDKPELKELPLHKYPVEVKDKFTKTINEFMYKEFVDKDGNHPDSYTYENGEFKGLFTPNNTPEWDFRAKEIRKLYHCPRSLAILEGSTKRAANPDYWVHAAINKIAFDESNTKLYVIPDLRYESEIEGLKVFFKDNLITIRINRFDNSTSNDPSERDLDGYKGFNHIISNKTDINTLYSTVDSTLYNLLNKNE